MLELQRSVATDEHHEEVKSLEEQLQKAYRTSPQNHEVHGHVRDAIGKISNDPFVVENPGEIEYVEQEESAETDMYKDTMNRASELSRGLSELQSTDLSFEELQETSEWARLTQLAEAYNQAVASLDWNEMSPSELDDIFRAALSIDTINDSLAVGKFDILTLDTILTSDEVSMGTFKYQYQYVNPESESKVPFMQNYLTLSNLRASDKFELAVKAYGFDRRLDDLKEGEDPLVDQLRARYGDMYITYHSIETAVWDTTDSKEVDAFNERMLARMDKILLQDLNLPKVVVDRFYYAALPRMNAKDESLEGGLSHYRGPYIKDRLDKLIRLSNDLQNNPDFFGWFSYELGVVNFDRYTIDDLINLYDLVSDSDKSVENRERIKEGDVTVVFADAYGDYNGAFDDMSAMYATEGNRTFIFEIEHPEQIYRYMLLLKKRGIKPSNIAIEAHGAPGMTSFGRAGNVFQFISGTGESTPGTQKLQIEKMSLERLVGDEFMKPDAQGMRRIILNSCSSAVESGKVKSVAESIVRTANENDVLVYGANDDLVSSGGLQWGLVFSSADDNPRKKMKSAMVEMSIDTVRGKRLKKKSLESLKIGSERKTA